MRNLEHSSGTSEGENWIRCGGQWTAFATLVLATDKKPELPGEDSGLQGPRYALGLVLTSVGAPGTVVDLLRASGKERVGP